MRITFLKVSNKMSALQEIKSREEALKRKSDFGLKADFPAFIFMNLSESRFFCFFHKCWF